MEGDSPAKAQRRKVSLRVHIPSLRLCVFAGEKPCPISVRRLFAKFLLKRRLLQVNVQLTELKH
jgi:hypothetical protein